MYLNSIGRTTRVALVALAVVFIGAGIAQATAATTIGTNVSTTGTLSVTGLASLLGGATTTQITLLSGDTIKNATASSTVISGALQTTGGFTGTTGTFSSTLGVSGDTTLASTTATSFKVGQTGTRLTRATAGYCVTDASAITASTTTMLTCTPSNGTGILTASDRVFVMATSSLPGRVYLSSASSTSAGTIQVNAFNTGIDSGTVGSASYAFNFWAFQ